MSEVKNKKLLNGLFDFEDERELIDLLIKVTKRSEKEVYRFLMNEYIFQAWNIRRAAEEYGVTAHVFNKEMEAFYNGSDAYVFSLPVQHLRIPNINVDNLFTQALFKHFPEGNKKLLCLGDGIGSDSLRFSLMGFDVTYFEFEGYSFDFAAQRFKRSNKNIKMLSNLDDVPLNHFDAVINREVLEHVPNPIEVVANIYKYLNDNGFAFITESFGRVEEKFPDHLLSNKKYDGKTVEIFNKIGFYYIEKTNGQKPLVFGKKEPIAHRSGKNSFLRRFKDKLLYL